MTAQTRTVNKGRFEDGDKPPGSSYVDLIDSFVSNADTTAQSLTSDLTVPKLIASTEVSATQVNATEVSASAGRFVALVAGTVRASGDAFIGGNLTVSGNATVSGNIAAANVSASSANIGTIDNAVQIGPAGQRGRPLLVQSKRVSSASTVKSTAANVPGGSDIIQIVYFQETPVAVSAGSQIDVLIGTSAHDTRFGRFSNVSAQGFYTISTSARTSAWTNVSGANAIIYVHVTAISGAVASAAVGKLSVEYVQNQ